MKWVVCMEIIKNIAAVIGCITAAIGLIGIIFKPIRKGISDWIKKIIGSSESANAIKRIDVSLLALDGKIDNLYERVEKLDQRVFENERDRIKAELSEYVSRCARGMKIYPEEKVHIDEIYTKYTNELHCNSTGSEFYHEISQYYEHQDWLKV